MEKPAYVHPSQGEAAHEYFKQLKSTEDRHWHKALGYTACIFASPFAAAIVLDVLPQAASNILSPALGIGIGLSFLRSTANLTDTDLDKQATTTFLAEAKAHYRTYQAPTPDWLENTGQAIISPSQQ